MRDFAEKTISANEKRSNVNAVLGGIHRNEATTKSYGQKEILMKMLDISKSFNVEQKAGARGPAIIPRLCNNRAT